MTQFGYASRSTSPALQRINARAEEIWREVREATASLAAVTEQLDEKRAQLIAMDRELLERKEILRQTDHAMSRVLAVQQIKKETAAEFGLPVDALKSDRRSKEFVLARARAAQRLVDELGLSTPHVGRILGNRDHTTIMHSLKPTMRARVNEWRAGRGR